MNKNKKNIYKRGPYKTKKRKLKKKVTIALIIIIAIMIILILLPFNTFKKDLKKLGYTNKEAETIDKVVSIQNHNLILKTKKNDTILKIITNSNYQDKNLKKYLTYYENNNNVSAEDIITIVNSGYDILDKDHNSSTAKLIKEKYFIAANLDRYITYKNNNKSLKTENIIAEVNSNLDKTQYVDTKEANTKDKNVILVNKYYYLDEDYEPTDLVTLTNTYNLGTNNRLRRDAANAFIKMADAALLDNIIIKNASGYRSYKYQISLYNSYESRDGKQAADTYSARPGFSEHQTGLATDINDVNQSFENTDAFKWLQKNAYKYGFILRFPKNKEKLTGYEYEPWHYRYVGKSIAKQIKEEDITLEEYYAYYVENDKE